MKRQVYDKEKQCRFCESTDNLTVDHIKPLRHGGKTTLDNLRVLCWDCHQELNRREAEEERKQAQAL